jgi:hypothetical protein
MASKQSMFLPISRADMAERGWDELDFLLISGDAYVDHPSFGHAIIGRLLERQGYRVGIIPQPDWHDASGFKILGRPRLAVFVASGVIDSMVNHYTASKKPRRDDAYSPGGAAGHRPDRAVIVYANRVREAFKNIPVILGGIEASLRRFAHYDYWDDAVRRSILLDAKADACAVDKKGRTPLSIAKAGGKVEIEDLLRARISRTPDAGLNIPQPPAQPVTVEGAKDIKTLAEEFVDHISKGEYAVATDYFDSNMKSLMPASKLSDTWQLIQSQVGRYKGRTATKTTKIQGFDVVLVTCQFEKATLDAQLAFDSSKQISGFCTVKPK